MSKIDFTGKWIFICNPKYWDVQNFLLDLKDDKIDRFDTWSVPEWQIKEFKPGQLGVIRVGHDTRTKKSRNGKPRLERGIYAVVRIVSYAKVKNGVLDNTYNLSEDASYTKKSYYIELEYISNLIENPILVEAMKSDKVLHADVFLIDGFQASSIPLKEKSMKQIILLKDISNSSVVDIEENPQLSDTEKDIIIKTRIGQSKLRKKIVERKNSTCDICGVDDEHLLIVSHIKPWAVSNNEDRLDENNVLLLCPNHDKLFDSGYISFNDNGMVIISNKLSESTISSMNLDHLKKLRITDDMKLYLKWHREYVLINLELRIKS